MGVENQLKILIIDDNTAIHQDFKKILTPKKQANDQSDIEKQLFGDSESVDSSQVTLPLFQIDTASQGDEGVKLIKKAKEEGAPYALAFVDIRMPPGMDGVETIKEIWKITPDIQTVICTAYSDYSWEDTVKEVGMKDNLLIIKKPFDTTAVRQLACALTKKWQLRQVLNENTKLLEKTVNERTDSLRQTLSLTRATLDSSADAIVVADKDGKIVDFNKQFMKMWGYEEHQLKLLKFKDFKDMIVSQIKSGKELQKTLDRIMDDTETVGSNFIETVDGRTIEVYTLPHKLEGKTIGRVWSFRDFTERAILEKKLEFQATHDTLTGLPNREMLTNRINKHLGEFKDKKKPFGILFIDLDRFKLVNDSLGHKTGDQLLKKVAQRLLGLVAKNDLVARLGGDEFVIVVSDSDTDKVIASAQKVLNGFKEPFSLTQRDLLMSPSIGIANAGIDGETVDDLLKNADLAMYQAKETGANQYLTYSEDLGLKAMNRLEREQDIARALKNEEFFLLYQPQLDLVTNQVTSMEALIRWQHPKLGVQLPLDFIPYTEDTGLIIPIGEWVLRTACAQNKKWHDEGHAKLRVAVNVASPQLKDKGFVSTVAKILEETELDPRYLEIEITENVILSNPEILVTLSELKELGVQISLDDFGTGISCLNYLREMNIDRLKIDKSFIDKISQQRSDEVIIRAIIDMANNLNYEVLAEGVETNEQLDMLKGMNCNSVQGYLYGKPMHPNEVIGLMQSKVDQGAVNKNHKKVKRFLGP